MREKVHILQIEYSESDAELAEGLMRKAGVGPIGARHQCPFSNSQSGGTPARAA
jgi:hypothetical protein